MELPAADAVAAVKGVVDVFDGELQERAVLWARLSFCSAGQGSWVHVWFLHRALCSSPRVA